MKRIIISVLCASLLFIGCSSLLELGVGNKDVYMANGIKIGEIAQDSAIIWTRLTRHPDRNRTGLAFPEYKVMQKEPELDKILQGHAVNDMQGSVPGSEGLVRIHFWPEDDFSGKSTIGWESVNLEADYTHHFRLTKLRTNTYYKIRVEGRSISSEKIAVVIESGFKTSANSNTISPILFTVVTGQRYDTRDDSENGQKIYPVMKAMKPDFFIHTGDIEYYDKPKPYSITLELARFKWNRLYSMLFLREFHNRVPSYFMKDDHDTLKDDAWPGQKYGQLTWEQGLSTFLEQVPMGDTTYRTIRWGKDLQIWLVEGRDFRSPNDMADGPDKTIWGVEQEKWFYNTVRASDASFRLLVSPTPLVGPDRPLKNDNHSNNAFYHEGNDLRKFIGSQKNMFVICGDRHWQYASIATETGIREYAPGATTDKHAGGWFNVFSGISKEKDKHQTEQTFVRVKGGFLSVTVKRIHTKPRIIFRHHDVEGKIVNEDSFDYQL